MDDYDNLSHSVWDCKYPVVFIPTLFPHFKIAISRQGVGPFLEEQGPRACGGAS